MLQYHGQSIDLVEGLCANGSFLFIGSLNFIQDHAHELPTLTRISHNYLVIPGAIVSVEQLFLKS